MKFQRKVGQKIEVFNLLELLCMLTWLSRHVQNAEKDLATVREIYSQRSRMTTETEVGFIRIVELMQRQINEVKHLGSLQDLLDGYQARQREQ